jgi:uncharacterized protein (DUF1501 family)
MAARPHRRAFLLSSLGGLAAFARPLGARRAPAPAPALVLVQLSGGCDGLSVLVPHANDVYARERRATRIQSRDVLPLDERVGLHPELGRLRELFEHGRLALVEGVGYPQPNRSHFRSLDIWHAADERGRAVGTGWLGRVLARLPDAEAHAVVHLGLEPPFSLQSVERAPLCVTRGLLRATDTERSGPLDAAEESGSHADAAGQASPALALVRERWRVARSSMARLRPLLAERASPVA